jgi:hypothetical protein
MSTIAAERPTTYLIELVKAEGLAKGERAIMVNGVRWGRTRVNYHGCHGQTHTFEQEEGDELEERPGTRYPGKVSVRSENRRHARIRAIGRDEPPDWKPTEQLVLEKVRELVAAGRLRDPSIVRSEHEAAAALYRKRSAEREIEEQAEFRRRACEALRINDETSEMVDRVVAAMRWAQTQ